jgi:hypothetical protein
MGDETNKPAAHCGGLEALEKVHMLCFVDSWFAPKPGC